MRKKIVQNCWNGIKREENIKWAFGGGGGGYWIDIPIAPVYYLEKQPSI